MESKEKTSFPVNRSLQRVLFATAWLFFAIQIVKYLILPPLSSDTGVLGLDFSDVYHAAGDLLQGTNPYLQGPGYPLMVPAMFSFLPFFSLSHAEFIWNILMRGSVLCGFLLILLAIKPQLSKENAFHAQPHTLSAAYAALIVQHWTTLAACMAAVFTPALLDIRVGNIQSLVFFFFCLFCTLLYHRRNVWAGVVLVFLCLIKIMPIFLLPVFFFSKQYRLFLTTVAGLLLYGLISLVTGGWKWEMYLFTQLLPHFPYTLRGVSYSLVHFTGIVFSPGILQNEAAYTQYANLIAYCILGTYLLVLVIMAKKYSGDGRREELASECLVLGVYSLTLASPLLETHHFTNCIPGWIFLFHNYLKQRCGHIYFFTALLLWCGIFSAREMAGYVSNWAVSPMYGATLFLLLLWLITVLRILFFLEKTPKVPLYSVIGSQNAP